MLTLNTKIERLNSVGPALKKTLNNLGIFYIQDLFFHLPFRYIDFSQKVPIGSSLPGQMVTLQGQLISVSARRSFRSRLSFTEATLEDESGDIKLIWFNQPYLAKQLHEGDHIVVAGKVEHYKQNQLTNPYFELIEPGQTGAGKILPIYHLTAGISNLRLAKLIKLAWDSVQPVFQETIDTALLGKFDLMNLAEAITKLHFPEDSREIAQGRLRMAVDDVLPQQIAAQIKQRQLEQSKAPTIPTDVEFIKGILADLPFALTDSQKRAAWDIMQDLSAGKPMNRLLEGDVGSGKTIVAILAALACAKNEVQTLILAPTEILAKQHLETFQKFSGTFMDQVGLLTGGFCIAGSESVSRPEFMEKVSRNNLKIIVGTHALFNEALHIPHLGLVVIDEQHRFGVSQRAFLGKQHGRKEIPHLLSMSATPIPRTLALSLFGNLAISQIKSLPKNRQAVITKLFSESQRSEAYRKILSEIAQGRQAFIITPKVEETDSNMKSVKAEYARLQKQFPKLKLGLVYGGMKSADKDRAMADFAARKLDILVATTVIEIGIDIPNATVMLIEGAENFGLAQLHQLRGRVGRGEHQSYCFLFTTDDAHSDNERLKIFEKNSDGFALAEFDLQQRGFGDLFGESQSGFNFRYPKFVTIEALQLARDLANDILDTDPGLEKHSQFEAPVRQYLQNIHTE